MLALIALPFLVATAAAGNIQYTIASGTCTPKGSGVFNSCDNSDTGSLCAYSPDVNGSWCCQPEHPTCGRWGQTCTGTSGLAGPGQVFCQTTGNSPTKWCCSSGLETCIDVADVFNLCQSTFDNPYNDTSTAEALSAKSAYFATTSSSAAATSSASVTKATSQIGVSLSQTTSSSHGSSTSPTAAASTGTQTSKPAASSKLSGGAIGGIAIGAVAVVALIAVGAFFLGRKYMQGQKNTAATINPDYAPVYPGYWQGGGYTDAGQKPQMQQPTELDAPEEMHELPSAARHELS